ncbi:hypothetical protein GCM10027168_40500 [Streptomyces capparidis]
MIGLIAATAAGAAARDRLAAAWPAEARVYTGPVREAVARAFAECDGLVCFLATGATVRLLAPLLGGKAADPGVVCVDEAQQYAVSLLGGHAGGANELAERVAQVLGCRPVVTTATDAVGVPGLDTLGLPVEGAVAAVSRAVLDGAPVVLEADAVWPLPALPPHVRPARDLPPVEADGDAVDGVVESSRHDSPRGDSHPDDLRVHHASSPAIATGSQDVQDLVADSDERAVASGGEGGGVRVARLLVTDRAVPLDGRTAVLRPPSLVVGVGASRGVPTEEVLDLIGHTLADAGLSPASVAALASVDAKADEAGLVEAAERLGVPLVTFPAEALARVAVPNPSAAPLSAVGTPSVAEAAALLAAEGGAPQNEEPGPEGDAAAPARRPGSALVVPKRKSSPSGRPAMCTVAVARRRPRGRLAVVGLGPGARDLLTPRAREELRRASVVVGLDQYVDQIRDLLRPGTRILESGLGAEEARARAAVAEARAGHAVALIGSGDAGVYAMASPALAEAGADIDVVGVPGVTAALAAGALLGAPLGHDHVAISLSDLHTPWEVIERRVRAAAEADLVVTFYNPRSRGRDWQLPKALALLAGHRPGTTPVGIVRAASRPGQWHTVTTLAEIDPAAVDMMTVVIVGNSATRTVAGRMVTPRGYRWQHPAPSAPSKETQQ